MATLTKPVSESTTTAPRPLTEAEKALAACICCGAPCDQPCTPGCVSRFDDYERD